MGNDQSLPPPHSLGKSREVSLSGKIFPWDPAVQQPMWIMMAGSTFWYLPVFATVADLREVMAHLGYSDFTIKQIQDHREFLDSIPSRSNGQELIIAIDVRLTEKKSLRFAQLARN